MPYELTQRAFVQLPYGLTQGEFILIIIIAVCFIFYVIPYFYAFYFDKNLLKKSSLIDDIVEQEKDGIKYWTKK